MVQGSGFRVQGWGGATHQQPRPGQADPAPAAEADRSPGPEAPLHSPAEAPAGRFAAGPSAVVHGFRLDALIPASAWFGIL